MGFADIGYQGMVYVGKNTPHMKLLRPFLEKKKVGCPFLLTSTSLPAVGRFSDAKPTYRRNWQQTNGAATINQSVTFSTRSNIGSSMR